MNARFFAVLLLLSFLQFDFIDGDNLWCYQCNTDLKNGHKSDCNDPYVPGYSSHLVSCPREEPHHCLKSVVLYRSIHVTVRGCVPSKSIDDYCHHEESFPDSSIECFFCKDYACNRAGSTRPIYPWNLGLIVTTLIISLKTFL